MRQNEIEGARAHAFTLDAHSLPWLEGALPAIARRRGTLAVVGGGRAGIEAAAACAQAHPTLRVVLVARELAPKVDARMRARLRQALLDRDVVLHAQQVIAVRSNHLVTREETIVFSACLWTVAPETERERGASFAPSGLLPIPACGSSRRM